MKNLKINIEKNIGYLKVDNRKQKIDKSVEINEDYFVDLNSKGEIIGIELLNPIEQLGIKYNKKYLYPTNFINELAFQVREGK